MKRLKKIIYIISIIFLSIVVVMNLLCTSRLDSAEHVEIQLNNLIYIIGLIVVGILIMFFTQKANNYLYKENNNKRKYLFYISIFAYILFNIIWGLLVNPGVGADQIHVCNLAQSFYRGNTEEILPTMTYAGIPLKQYIECYPQQITLAFVYSIFFRIIHLDIIELLRIINIISNICIIIALYKINNQISKKYETNKVLLLTLILTFISIPMLLTFIYGDMPSLALCLFSVYFIMKYREYDKPKYLLLSTILTAISYMMRMNSLIFIIATVLYLILNLLEEFKNRSFKLNIIKASLIIVYIAISIIPTSLVKNYYFNKYNLDENKKYPTISFLLIAMEESPRANGWYSEEIR